jgi:hypothetical protein
VVEGRLSDCLCAGADTTSCEGAVLSTYIILDSDIDTDFEDRRSDIEKLRKHGHCLNSAKAVWGGALCSILHTVSYNA